MIYEFVSKTLFRSKVSQCSNINLGELSPSLPLQPQVSVIGLNVIQDYFT